MDYIKKQILKSTSTIFLNTFANGLINYSIGLEFLKLTGSSLSFGVGIIVGPLTGLLVAPLIALLIDKYPKKNLALVGLLGIILTTGLYLIGTQFFLKQFILESIAFMIFTGVSMRLFNLSYISSSANLVGMDNVQKLSAAEQGAFSVVAILQPAIAATVWSLFGITSITLSALVLSILTIPIVLSMNFTKFAGEEQDSNESNSTTLRDAFKYMLANKRLLQLIVITGVMNIFIMGFEVVRPFVLLHQIHLPPATLGLLQSLVGISTLLGATAAFLKHVKKQFSAVRFIYLIDGIVMLGLGALLTFTTHNIIVVAAFTIASMVTAAIGTVSDTVSFSYIQESTNPMYIGRIITIFYTIIELFQPIGSIVGSYGISVVPRNVLFIIFGTVIVLLSLIMYRRDSHE